MAKYLNPFTDFGFKRLFGQEANKELLIDFLNDLLEGDPTIVDVSYQDKEVPGFMRGERTAIYDIYCTTAGGEHVIVEM